MDPPTIEELAAAWAGRASTRSRSAGPMLRRTAVRLLADGEPVPADRIAEAATRPLAEVQDWLEQMCGIGWQFDEHQRLVGAALTLLPTTHRFTVRGRQLYAWCGLDTLFLPMLLDEPATVASTCPITGRPIVLEIAAEGSITHVEPATTVVAVVGQHILDTCAHVGPGSPICDHMPLLADSDAAQRWARARNGVAILDLPAASRLARTYLEHGCC